MRVLELGVGGQPHPEATVRHDLRRHSPWIDVAHDLNQIPWPWDDESFEQVLAFDVMEHLDLKIVIWMNEVHRILVPNGLFTLRAPVDGGPRAWSDPTHQRVWAVDTFEYFDPATEMGRRYWFYTDQKWRELSRRQIDHTSWEWVLQKLC